MTEEQRLLATYWPFRDVLEPDDSEYAPRGASCVKISDALGRVGEENVGLFAFGGSDCALPALPGLVVRDAGVIPIPLAESFARCLLDRCSEVGASTQRWELPADQLWMKNPEWNRRMGDLGAAVGEKLGFQDALLDVILSKLEVFGPGGRVQRTVDNGEAEGVVATLVVQLPSLHEGAELVVYDDDDAAKKYTFDFGKATRTAPFKPSYAVYVAGAEYEVTEVKSGYRVALVYSIRLPPDETMEVNRSRRSVQKELREAVAEFGGAKETFALLLEQKYGGFHALQTQGAERLTGVDNARFQALRKANSLVPTEKRLKFHVAKLRHTANIVKDLGTDGTALFRTYPRIKAIGGDMVESWWRIKETSEATVWLSADQDLVPDWGCEKATDSTLKWTSQFNFLNPGHDSPHVMWSKHARSLNAATGYSIEYEAYALVGWPATSELENTTHFIGEDAALTMVLADVPVSATKLKIFMNIASGKELENNDQADTLVCQYTDFCRKICKAITVTGDVELAWLFFVRYFGRVKRKEQLAHSMVELVKTLSWAALCVPITNAINGMTGLNTMVFALEMTMNLSDTEAVTMMARLAVAKAQQISIELLSSSSSIGLLWRTAVTSEDKTLFPAIVTMCQQMEAGLLGPVVERVAQTIAPAASKKERAALASLVSMRRRWLQSKVSHLVSWEMTEAEFPAHAGVQTFLRGPKSSFVISGFPDAMAADRYIKHHGERQSPSNRGPSFIMTAHGTGVNSMVIITKTREHDAQSKEELDKLTAELKRLDKLSAELVNIRAIAPGEPGSNALKRPRTDLSSDEHQEIKKRWLEAKKEAAGEGPAQTTNEPETDDVASNSVPPSA